MENKVSPYSLTHNNRQYPTPQWAPILNSIGVGLFIGACIAVLLGY